MEKILLVTYYAADNYGAFLQAYSLYKFLEDHGFSVSVLRDSEMENMLQNGDSDFKRKRNNFLAGAISEKLSVTDLSSDMYDYAILGSDEIWNKNSATNSSMSMYWGKGINAKKIIAYAPCAINVSSKRLFFKLYNLIKINSISARDIVTKNKIEKLIHRDVNLVLDPTFLVSYANVPAYNYQYPYLAVYSYGLDDSQVLQIREFAARNGLKVILSGYYADWADEVFNGSPFEWLSFLKSSAYVVTSTFHGTVFSIIFKKKFITLGTNTKAKLLLQQFNIDGEQLPEKILWDKAERLDYNKIGYVIEELRQQSEEFLFENLSAFN